MNAKQVFLSVLLFGTVGLLFFMYLQVWIEEQHTGRIERKREQKEVSEWRLVHSSQRVPRTVTTGKIQKHIVNQNSYIHMPEDLKKKGGNLLNLGSKILKKNSHSQREDQAPGSSLDTSIEIPQGAKPRVFQQPIKMDWPLVTRPLNKSSVQDNKWKKAYAIQEKRRSFLHEFCKKYGGINDPQANLYSIVSRIYVEDKHRVLYCEVPKAGCSNWKRILMVLNGLASSAYNISHEAVHYGKHLKTLASFDLKGIYMRLNTYSKAVFVRDPMERLVSAFRDKFEHPNSYYHPVFGKAIIKKYRPNANTQALNNGSGVQFKEFVHYLLDDHRPVGMDIHWEKISKLCYPCLINYDFVGKFETLEEDANYFLHVIGAPKELKFPNFKDRHSSDERTSTQVVRQYLKDLGRAERQLLYDFYHLDYLMFNYTAPHL
ncbi:carbohydrate sulfotransferase 9 [Psammomys obesus]|uniref:carbohydrate sulfotransferase 9 n=1 Tax=Psammomys obesus TaxID=48139 RepID=UPI00245344F3|nr:carbohydrate sulfotransferase 9 [Psammomys obesus]